MTDEPQQDKKPNIVINIFNFAKDYAKDQAKKIVYTAITGFIIWGSYQIQTSVNKITSLPKKYDSILLTIHNDSLKAISHIKEDSLKDIANATTFLSLKHKVDSLSGVVYNHSRWNYKMWNRIDSLSIKNQKFNFKKL